MQDIIQDMKKRINSLSNEALIEMLELKSHEYSPEAIKLANEEVEKRGGLLLIKRQIAKMSEQEQGEIKAENKQRHGCVTAWLTIMIIANAISSLVYLFDSGFIKQIIPNAPPGTFLIFFIISIVNIACAAALFRWKRWGFYGFSITSIFALIVNISIGLGIVQSSLGLVGLAILYGLLHVGKERKAWIQLK